MKANDKAAAGNRRSPMLKKALASALHGERNAVVNTDAKNGLVSAGRCVRQNRLALG